MRTYAADLHIHTALSPCAAEEMTPPAIVCRARETGLDLIAICDHNSARNTHAVIQAASGSPAVIAGIEITTSEEVHLLGLFPDPDAAQAVARMVESTLPPYAPSRHFGRPRVLNARGAPSGALDLLLGAASTLPLENAVEIIRRHGGLAVPSHVDRPSFSLLSQLGLFPDGVPFDAVELSPTAVNAGRAADLIPPPFPIIVSSDSHNLDEVGRGRTLFTLAAPDFPSLVANLRENHGRTLLA